MKVLVIAGVCASLLLSSSISGQVSAQAKGGDNKGADEKPRQTTSQAIKAALQWLADHQAADGSWSASDFAASSVRKKNGAANAGNIDFTKERAKDTGEKGMDRMVTALALLAFAGDGNTHQDGTFKNNVKNGLNAVKGWQDAEGCFGSAACTDRLTAHAICVQVVAEIAYMTMDAGLTDCANKGYAWLGSNANATYVWTRPDASKEPFPVASAWVALALNPVALGGFKADGKGLFEKLDGSYAKALVAASQPAEPAKQDDVKKDSKGKAAPKKDDKKKDKKDTKGKKPEPDAPASPAAPGLFGPRSSTHAEWPVLGLGSALTKMFSGKATPTDDSVTNPVKDLLKVDVSWEYAKLDFAALYLGSLTVFQTQDDSWGIWKGKVLEPVLLAKQRGFHAGDLKVKDAKADAATLDEHGSWDPVDAYGASGGRVYATAMNVLALEVFARAEHIRGK